jgi:hypothetical protein
MLAAFKPIKELNVEFKLWKDRLDYDLRFNGQTINLEHVLNDLFDNSSRRIYIQDTSIVNYVYVSNKIEGSGRLYLSNKSETTAPDVYFENRTEQTNQIHFKVMVPSSLGFSVIQMKALVDKYKIAGVKYQIESI